MSTKELFRRLRELHERHKRGSLPPEEASTYRELREDGYAAWVRAQQRVQPGRTSRQTFRVAAGKRLQLTIAGRAIDTMTSEIGLGGFAAFVDAEIPHGSSCEFVLSAGGHPLRGQASVVACVRHGSGGITHRASFELDAMSGDDLALLEVAVLDAALALVPK
jgi:hypothetical protein